MIALVLVSLVSVIAYFFLKLNYLYWEKRGIRGPKPLPIIGNLGKCALFLEPLAKLYRKIYNDYQNEEVVGLYRGTTPTLMIRDPDLIKEVVVKSFSNFHDNEINVDKNLDPLLGRSPFVLKGEEWKAVRSQITPGFTSGKIKWMYPFVEEVSSNLVNFIEQHSKTTNSEGYEAKELAIRFTLNNVASCGFGIQGKCLEEKDSEFRQLSREFFQPGGWTMFNFMLHFLFPGLQKYLPVKVLKKKTEEKLLKIVTETLKHREENGIVRNDFLDSMNQLKKTCKAYEFTNVDVTAQAATFFAEGSETSSVTMSFALYELAANREVQEKLRKDVNAAFDNNNQKLSFEILQSLEYLDAVINETLRKHPPLALVPKVCTETFKYTPKNSQKPIVVEKGTSIVIPIWGLQMDPKYYPEPDSFKPERFMSENKEKLTKYTFMAFGEGPRACLGRRFAFLQIKLGLAYIVRNFELSVNKKTKQPLEYMNAPFTLAEGGLWIDYKKIVN